MPPPPPPASKEQKESVSDGSEDIEKKKLETPLAAMLPSKYANVDVTELFPDFRHGKVKLSIAKPLYSYNEFIAGTEILKTVWTWKAKQFAEHLEECEKEEEEAETQRECQSA